MTKIEVYDVDAEAIIDKANELGTTVAEIVEALSEHLDEVE